MCFLRGVCENEMRKSGKDPDIIENENSSHPAELVKQQKKHGVCDWKIINLRRR